MRCQHLELSKFEEVLTVLGGTAGVAQLTGRGDAAVRNWKSAGRFPPATYGMIITALAERGLTAPISLWDFEPRQA